MIQTLHLDRMRAESVRLADFHVGPTCSPTRAGLMTGRYCNCTGVWHTLGGRSLLRRDEVTLAEAARDGRMTWKAAARAAPSSFSAATAGDPPPAGRGSASPASGSRAAATPPRVRPSPAASG